MTPVAFRQKFKRDLARGSLFEDFIAEYFQKRGWSVKRAKGFTPSYDMILTKGDTSVYTEVKYDELSDLTQNYALEKASLDHTQSSVLIIGTKELAWVIPMDTARKLFEHYPKKQTGDIATNYSALVPKSVFIENNFHKLVT